MKNHEPIKLDIYAPVFGDMLAMADKKLQQCLAKCDEGKFDGGEITVKLSIDIVTSHERYLAKDEYGNDIEKIYEYKRPVVAYKAALLLKEKSESQGVYNEERELKRGDDGDFYLDVVESPQVSIDEIS